jgi:hypothetical protein
MRHTRLLGTAAVLAVVAGALISVLAFVVARYGPAGDGWSFRGNGALAVYTLIPVLLTTGWTALVLHARSVGSWLSLGLGAGLVALLIALADALLIPLFGTSADATFGAVLLIALVAWMVVAPALATRIPPAGSAFYSVGPNLAAGAVWLVGLLAGLVLIGFLIPAGS